MRSRSTLALVAGLIVLVLMNLNEVLTRDRSKDTSDRATTRSHERVERERAVRVERSRVRENVFVTADGEKMIDRTFDVSEGENLAVQVAHMDVDVETRSGGTAHIEVFLDGRNMELARAYFEDMRLSVEKNGDTIEIKTNRRQNARSSGRSGGAKILVKAYIPEHFNVDLALSHGDVSLDELIGQVEMRTSHGDIEVSSIQGPFIDVAASHGDFEARDLEADNITVRVSHGDFEAHSVFSNGFVVQASHGDISVSDVSGTTEASNSHGDIEIGFSNLEGASLRNSHGDITIQVPGSTGANLDFSATGIRFDSEVEFEGTKKQDRVNGLMNGGGATLAARTTHGSIRLKTP